MKKISSFLESGYFIILTSIFTVICWYLKVPKFAYLVYLIFMFLIIISNTKRYVFGMIILNAIINYQIDLGVDGVAFSKYLMFFLPISALVIVTLIIDIIIRKPKFKLSGVSIGFLSIILVNLFSLINIKETEILKISLIGIIQLVAFLLVYMYFDLYKTKEAKLYMSKTALILASAITGELIIHYLSIGGALNKSSHDLSWGVSNVIAMFYLVLIPLGFYLYFSDQMNYYVIPITGINFLMLIFMLSRGAMLTVLVIIIPMIVFSIYIIKERKRFLIDLISSLIIVILVSVIITQKSGLLDTFLDYIKDIDFTNGNGRIPLYRIGLDLFKEYPIFGAGAYSGAYYLEEFHIGTYHNYVIQALATTGVIGLISLLYFTYEIFKASTKKDTFNNLFAFSMAAILIHGLVDNTFYNPIIMIFFAIMLPLLNNDLICDSVLTTNDNIFEKVVIKDSKERFIKI